MIAMTFVGTKYYKASFDAQIGNKCTIDIINGTCKLLNNNGEEMGVLPASPYKLKQVEAMGFPLIENGDGRTMNIFHQEFVITTIISSSMIVVEEVVEEIVEETIEGESMENKIKALTKDTIVRSILKNGATRMSIELMNDSLKEAYECATKEYPMETLMYSAQYIDLHPIATMLMVLRSIDELVSLRYLKGEISDGEFDHMRVFIGVQAYFYYKNLIEEVSMKEFFPEASLKASEKFGNE